MPVYLSFIVPLKSNLSPSYKRRSRWQSHSERPHSHITKDNCLQVQLTASTTASSSCKILIAYCKANMQQQHTCICSMHALTTLCLWVPAKFCFCYHGHKRLKSWNFQSTWLDNGIQEYAAKLPYFIATLNLLFHLETKLHQRQNVERKVVA